MSIAEQVYEQVKGLPDRLAREVLDFAGLLRARQDQAEWRDLAAAQSPALASIWDNDQDEIWNDV